MFAVSGKREMEGDDMEGNENRNRNQTNRKHILRNEIDGEKCQGFKRFSWKLNAIANLIFHHIQVSYK